MIKKPALLEALMKAGFKPFIAPRKTARQKQISRQKFWNEHAKDYPGSVFTSGDRKLILKFLSRHAKGKRLDLMSGKDSYLTGKEKFIVAGDRSHAMIYSNPVKNRTELDAHDLPFKDKSFNSVTILFGINYLEESKKTIQEIKRVLADSGRLILINNPKLNLPYEWEEVKKFKLSEVSKILKAEGFEVLSERKTRTASWVDRYGNHHNDPYAMYFVVAKKPKETKK